MATFVLIHGAAGSAWYWHLLEPELRERGHDVVSRRWPPTNRCSRAHRWRSPGPHVVALSRPTELAERLDSYVAELGA